MTRANRKTTALAILGLVSGMILSACQRRPGEISNVNGSGAPSPASSIDTQGNSPATPVRLATPIPTPSPDRPIATLSIPSPSEPKTAALPQATLRYPEPATLSGEGPGSGGGGNGYNPNPAPLSRTQSGEVDYNRVFSRKEVNWRVRILDKPEPQYTAIAREHDVTGTVVLRALFTGSGEITEIKVVQGLPDGLNESAIAAARRIKFTPAMRDGHRVSMYLELQYNFNLY